MTPSFDHVTHGKVKLGLARRPRLFRMPLSNYVAPSALAFPPVHAWERPIYWGMLGNDSVGDCVIAWMLHQIIGWNAVAHAGTPVSFTGDQAISVYSAITGYNPADPNTDQGTDPDAAITYWKNTGILGDKVAGSVDLDISNLDMLKGALYTFGGIGLSIQVPAYVMQVSSGGSWSNTGGDQNILGYHQILACGYGRQGFRFVSWGTTYTCDFNFLSDNLQAAQAVVSTDWIRQSQTSPSGLDLNALLADLAITRERFDPQCGQRLIGAPLRLAIYPRASDKQCRQPLDITR